jgi:O-antigen/teichoic acid export membrane protein
MLLFSINLNVPRYFIQNHLGAYQLGLFAALTSLTVIDSTVVNALGMASTSRLSQAYSSGDYTQFRRMLQKLLIFSLLLGAIMLSLTVIAGAELISRIYRPEYAANPSIFIIIMLGSWLSDLGIILGYGMTSARLLKVQVPLCLLILLATCGGCALLVPKMGLVGSSIALVLSEFVRVAGYAMVLWWVMRSHTAPSALQPS